MAPILSSSSPADDTTAVAVDSNIVLNFSEAVDVESGNIVIYKASDNSAVETIAVGSGQVTGSGTTQITIDPNGDLASSTQYYVQIAATGFDDTAGNSYAGITNTTSLSFTTADIVAPTMAITASEVNDGDKSNDGTLSLTFTSSEATTNFVVGDITVSGGSLSSFAALSSTVYTATFTPSGDGAQTIDVASNKFTDAAGNNNTAATQFNWTYDGTAPTLNSVSIASNNSTSTQAVADDVVILTFTASEAIITPVVTFQSGGAAITDTDITYTNTSGHTWTAAYTVNASDTSGAVTFSIAYSDTAGNAGTAVTSGTGSITYDGTADTSAPTVGDYESTETKIECLNGSEINSIHNGAVKMSIKLKDINGTRIDPSSVKSVVASVVSGEGILSTNPSGQIITIPNNANGIYNFEVISQTSGTVVIEATVTTTSGETHVLPGVTDIIFENTTEASEGSIDIRTQPVLTNINGLLSGALLDTQPVVRLLDKNGDVKESDNSTKITARIISGEGGSLNANGDETEVTVVGGVASFTGLKLTGVANETYRLVFMANNFVAATSENLAFTTTEVFTTVKDDIESKMAANARTQLNDFTTSISSIVGSARSRFMNTSGVADNSDTALSGDISSTGSDLKGSTKRVTSTADGKATSIVEVQYQYTETKEGLKSQNATGQIINEAKLSDNLTFGRYLGASLGDGEAIGTSNIDIEFMGAQAGAYLIGNTKGGVIYDTYFAGSVIENKIVVTTDLMEADSKYYSSMLTTGASITGRIQVKKVEIRPTLSTDLSYMFSETADFHVKVGSATSVEQAAYGDISKAQITFAPEFRLPFGEGSVITATPNVMCRYLKQGTATEDCGQGLSLGFKSTSKDGLLNLTAKAGIDRIGNETTSTLKLQFEQRF